MHGHRFSTRAVCERRPSSSGAVMLLLQPVMVMLPLWVVVLVTLQCASTSIHVICRCEKMSFGTHAIFGDLARIQIGIPTIASITFHSSFPLSHGTATAATTATCIANLLNLWRCVLVDTAAFVRRILMIPHCRAGHKRKRYAHERSTNRTIRSRHNRQRTKRRRERIQEVSL